MTYFYRKIMNNSRKQTLVVQYDNKILVFDSVQQTTAVYREILLNKYIHTYMYTAVIKKKIIINVKKKIINEV